MSKRDRAAVNNGISDLEESLDEERSKEIEAKWAAESEERIDAVDRGELLISGQHWSEATMLGRTFFIALQR